MWILILLFLLFVLTLFTMYKLMKPDDGIEYTLTLMLSAMILLFFISCFAFSYTTLKFSGILGLLEIKMSRTKRGSKPMGYEYWGKMKGGGMVNRKTSTKMQRMKYKEDDRELLKEYFRCIGECNEISYFISW